MPDDPSVFRGVIRSLDLPSCALSVDDLRLLANLLGTLAAEAAEKAVADLRPTQGQKPEELAAMQAELRKLLRLSVQVQGAGGDWINGPPELACPIRT